MAQKSRKMEEKEKRRTARLIKKERERICKLENAARAMGMTGIIKPSHVLRLPGLRDILHPNEEVLILIPTVKVFEDKDVPLVLIDIIVRGKITTIDLAKLDLSKKNQNILIDSGVLPKRYFSRIRNNASETMQGDYSDPGMLDYEVEYIPTSTPN
ncbi:hypothetical protein JXE04_02190 [Patescibacteria group bacterium]|nr:hypothetical protein [Patescibacteria group bacterium]